MFGNLKGKVFNIYSYYYSTYIHVYRVVSTYKTRQIFFFFGFATTSDILIPRYIFGNACIAITCISGHCHIHIVNILYGNSINFIMYYDIMSSIDTK